MKGFMTMLLFLKRIQQRQQEQQEREVEQHQQQHEEHNKQSQQHQLYRPQHQEEEQRRCLIDQKHHHNDEVLIIKKLDDDCMNRYDDGSNNDVVNVVHNAMMIRSCCHHYRLRRPFLRFMKSLLLILLVSLLSLSSFVDATTINNNLNCNPCIDRTQYKVHVIVHNTNQDYYNNNNNNNNNEITDINTDYSNTLINGMKQVANDLHIQLRIDIIDYTNTSYRISYNDSINSNDDNINYYANNTYSQSDMIRMSVLAHQQQQGNEALISSLTQRSSISADGAEPVDALIVSIPNDNVADTIREMLASYNTIRDDNNNSVSSPIPIFGMGIGASSSLLLSNITQLLQGFISSNEDTIYGEIAAKEFLNITTNSNNNDIITKQLEGAMLLSTAVYVDSILEPSYITKNQYSTFGKTLQEYNVNIIARIVIDPRNITDHIRLIDILFDQCPYRYILLSSITSVQYAIAANEKYQCRNNTKIGVTHISNTIYEYINNGNILFGMNSQYYIQSSLSLLLTSYYITTGKKLPIDNGNILSSGPVIMKQNNIPTDSYQTCQYESFPVCVSSNTNNTNITDITDIRTTTGIINNNLCTCTNRTNIRLGGVVHGVITDPFWDLVFEGARQASVDIGNIELDMIRFKETESFDILVEQMATKIKQLCESNNLDGIFITIPITSTNTTYALSLINSIQICQSFNIPIISINSGEVLSNELNILHHVAQDEYQAGYNAGIKLISTGNIKYGYCLNQDIGNIAQISRCEGFEDSILYNNNNQTTNNNTIQYMGMYEVPLDNKVQYKNNVETYISNNPNYDNIDNDWSGIGILCLGTSQLDSLRDVKQDHPNLIAGTFDIDESVYNAMKDYIILFGIDQQQYWQGSIPIYLLTYMTYTKQYLLNQKINTGGNIITSVPNENQQICDMNMYQVCEVNETQIDNTDTDTTDEDISSITDDIFLNDDTTSIEYAVPVVKLECTKCVDRTNYTIQAILYGNETDTKWQQIKSSMVQAAYDMRVNMIFTLLGSSSMDSTNYMSEQIRLAANNASIDAIIVNIPNMDVEDTIRTLMEQQNTKPFFGIDVGYQLAKSLNIQGYIGLNDKEAGIVAANEFIKYHTDPITNKSSLRKAVFVPPMDHVTSSSFVPSGEDISISSHLQFTGFNRTLYSDANGDDDMIVDMAVVDIHDDASHTDRIGKLFVNCPYQAVLLGSDLSLARAISSKSQNNCIETQIGIMDANNEIYNRITSAVLLFGIHQDTYTESAFNIILTTLYITTGKKLSLPVQQGAYLSRPTSITLSNVPSDTMKKCELESFPICGGPLVRETNECSCIERKEIRIGAVVHGDKNDDFWDPIFAAAEQAANDMNVTLLMQRFDPQEDNAVLYDKMSTRIKTLCDDGVDGIFVTIPNISVVESIESCMRLKVPVISINAGAALSAQLGLYHHIAQSEYIAGLEAGKRLIEIGMKTGYCPDHAFGNSGTADRCRGFSDSIKQANEAGGAVVDGGTFAVKADDVQQYILTVEKQVNQDGDWDGIGLMSLGLAQLEGLIELAKTHTKVIVGTFDVSTDLMDSIQEGWMKFGIDQQAFLQGNLPVYLLTYLAYSQQTIWNQAVESGPSFLTMPPSEAQTTCESKDYLVCVPVPTEDYNYIQTGFLVLGYIMFGIIVVICIVTGVWIYIYQNEWIIKVSQPALLGMVIVGCFISSLSIIFIGYEAAYANEQDSITAQPTGPPNPDVGRADAACMAVPWLYGMGFVISFAALFAKIQRVKMIYTAGLRMQRKAIGLKDVAYIVAFLLTIEFAILLTWQLVAPLEWQREAYKWENGFPVESIGSCTYEDSAVFYIIMVTFNIICLFYALVLCFQTKDINSDFAESSYISLAVAFSFQVLVLAVPISALVRDTSTNVFYFIRVSAVFLQNFTVLGLLFIPKMIKHHFGVKEDDRNTNSSAKSRHHLKSNTRDSFIGSGRGSKIMSKNSQELQNFQNLSLSDLSDRGERRRSSSGIRASLEDHILQSRDTSMQERTSFHANEYNVDQNDSSRLTRTAAVEIFLSSVSPSTRRALEDSCSTKDMINDANEATIEFERVNDVEQAATIAQMNKSTPILYSNDTNPNQELQQMSINGAKNIIKRAHSYDEVVVDYNQIFLGQENEIFTKNYHSSSSVDNKQKKDCRVPKKAKSPKSSQNTTTITSTETESIDILEDLVVDNNEHIETQPEPKIQDYTKSMRKATQSSSSATTETMSTIATSTTTATTTSSLEEGEYSNNNNNNSNDSTDKKINTSEIINHWNSLGFKSLEQARAVLALVSEDTSPEERKQLIGKL